MVYHAYDREWMQRIVAEAAAQMPAHRSAVIWAPAERGVPHFSVQCRTCGQIAIGVDKAALTALASEHERIVP